MLLYADEDFSFPVVEELRKLGHDVLTAQGDGRKGASDREILARAHALTRAVLAYSRRHFERLHRQGEPHSGMVTAKHDNDFIRLSARIDINLKSLSTGRWCLRVNRPP